MPLVVVASVMCAAWGLSALTRRALSLCLLAVVAGVVDVLYIAGLVGHLHLAARAVFFAGFAIAAAGTVWATMRGRIAASAKALLAPESAVFLGAVLLYWAFYNQAAFHLWDEFSHWGLAAKEMYLTSRLPLHDAVTNFQDYPSGTAVFYYFITDNSYYSEGAVYLGFFVMLTAPLTLLLRGRSWHEAHWVAATAVTALLLMLVCGCAYHGIYVDPLLGILLGMAVYAAVDSPSPRESLPFLVPVLFFLPLVKKSGAMLALVCLAVIIADTALRFLFGGSGPQAQIRRAGRGLLGLVKEHWRFIPFALYVPRAIWLALASRWGTATAELAALLVAGILASPPRAAAMIRRIAWLSALRVTLLAALVLSAPFISYVSWQRWVTANRLTGTFEAKGTLADAYRSLRADRDSEAGRMRARFADRLEHRMLSVYEGTIYTRLKARLGLPSGPERRRLTAAGWTAFVLALFAAAAWLARGRGARARIVTAGAVLMLGFAFYLFGLFSLYALAFDAGEAAQFPQMERYVWTYLAAMALAGWGLLAASGRGAPPGISGLSFGACLAFALLLYVFENALFGIVPPRKWAEPTASRAEMAGMAAFIESKVPSNESVLIVFQRCQAMDRLALRYELVPRPVEFVICVPDRSGDPADAPFNVSLAEWEDWLSSGRFDHVYIADADDRFWSTYGECFDAEFARSGCLFRVKPESSPHQ